MCLQGSLPNPPLSLLSLSLMLQDGLSHLPASLEMAKKLSPTAVSAVVATKADLYRNRKIATEDAVVRKRGEEGGDGERRKKAMTLELTWELGLIGLHIYTHVHVSYSACITNTLYVNVY